MKQGCQFSQIVNETTLDNGLRVVSHQVPGMHSVTIGIWVANGASSELPTQYGVAHFIEHLLFKGTEKRTARQITREIDSLGGILNAFTSYEYVCYYAKGLSNTLPQLVDILSDIFLNSTFPADEIERERGVVLQELKMREDSPDDAIHDRLHQSFWKGTTLGHPILGTDETISNMGRDTILDFRQKWYQPGQIIIAVAGGVEHNQLVSLLQGAFASIEPAEISPLDQVQQINSSHIFEVTERDLEQTLICLGTKGLSGSSPDRYKLMVMNAVLGGGMSSRLFEEVREKRGLAYAVYSYSHSFTDAGGLAVYAGTGQERSSETLAIILTEMSRLKHETVPEDELNAAREQIKGKLLMSLESSDSYMSRLARNYIVFGKYQPLEDVLAGFDAVTATDVQQMADSLFRNDYLNVQVMGKVNGEKLAAKARFT